MSHLLSENSCRNNGNNNTTYNHLFDDIYLYPMYTIKNNNELKRNVAHVIFTWVNRNWHCCFIDSMWEIVQFWFVDFVKYVKLNGNKIQINRHAHKLAHWMKWNGNQMENILYRPSAKKTLNLLQIGFY